MMVFVSGSQRQREVAILPARFRGSSGPAVPIFVKQLFGGRGGGGGGLAACPFPIFFGLARMRITHSVSVVQWEQGRDLAILCMLCNGNKDEIWPFCVCCAMGTRTRSGHSVYVVQWEQGRDLAILCMLCSGNKDESCKRPSGTDWPLCVWCAGSAVERGATGASLESCWRQPAPGLRDGVCVSAPAVQLHPPHPAGREHVHQPPRHASGLHLLRP